MITVLYFISIAFFMLLAVLLSTVILMQESKSTGLGSSFGSDTQDSLFGTSTADVLKKFTGWLSFIFLASCIILSFWTSSMGRSNQSTTPAGFVQEIEEN